MYSMYILTENIFIENMEMMVLEDPESSRIPAQNGKQSDMRYTPQDDES